MKKFYIVLAVACSFTVLLPAASASAATPIRERIQEKRCTIAENRISILLTRMKNVGEKRTTTYQNLKEKVQTAITKAENAGYDTTKLTTSMTSLDTAIKDYRATTISLYEKIQNTQNYACGESEGDFAEALRAARQQMPVVKQAAQHVHEVFTEQVKPELKAFREWLKNKES